MAERREKRDRHAGGVGDTSGSSADLRCRCPQWLGCHRFWPPRPWPTAPGRARPAASRTARACKTHSRWISTLRLVTMLPGRQDLAIRTHQPVRCRRPGLVGRPVWISTMLLELIAPPGPSPGHSGTPSPHTFIFSGENAVCKDSQHASQATPDIDVCKNPYRQRSPKRK